MHGPDAASAMASLAHTGEDLVEVEGACRTGRLTDKAAEESTVYTILPRSVVYVLHISGHITRL